MMPDSVAQPKKNGRAKIRENNKRGRENSMKLW